MSLLPDWVIEDYSARPLVERLALIDPYRKEQLQPCSYDIRLSHEIRRPHLRGVDAIDLRKPLEDRTEPMDITDGFVLMPGRFVLGASRERLCVPDGLAARVDGKSSLARVGLQIHSAGFVDPGYEGDITLEIANLGEDPVLLWPDIYIAQVEFVRLSASCRQPYKGRYQYSTGPVASRFNQSMPVEPELLESYDPH